MNPDIPELTWGLQQTKLSLYQGNDIMSQAATAQQATPLKLETITKHHEYHQNAMSMILQASLDDEMVKERKWYTPLLDAVLKKSQNTREMFFWILDIDEKIGYPASGFHSPDVNKLFVTLVRKAPQLIIHENAVMAASDLSPLNFIMACTELDFNNPEHVEYMKGAPDVMPTKAHRWTNEIRAITKQYFVDSSELELSFGDKIYTLTLAKLVEVIAAFHEIIDLGYWKKEVSFIDNLVACNISPDRVLQYLMTLTETPRQEIMGRLTAEWRQHGLWSTILDITDTCKDESGESRSRLGRGYSNYGYSNSKDEEGMNRSSVFIPLREHHRILTRVWEETLIALSSENDDEKAKQDRYTTLEHIRSHCRNEDRDDKKANGLTVDHWRFVLANLEWFNRSHRYERDGIVTKHHGHTFVELILDLTINQIREMQPNQIFETVFDAKHKSTLEKMAGYKFPQLPEDLAALLPEGVEYISSPARLYTEGEVMHHCCGGESYLSSTAAGRSMFFHIEAGTEHGCTMEVKGMGGNQPYTQQARGLQNRNLTDAEHKVEAEILKVLNEYCTKSPEWAPAWVNSGSNTTSGRGNYY